ncbi:oligosaccharide flippase family protein [Sphingomonas mollis]|uniref:Oligosaccharide flippase family protein n=1 Tax=Sphingomonas mollis TaxID=2795726 RepID=A0ABS0XTI0_9SPHN|nr:oligosaccharide flippase family protein [Sphingomonas sp. BT553]MBJ6123341.1 oligosaccharide flippase family protein [Sphingomonas sp. BT553]
MSVRRSLAWAFSGQFAAFSVQFVGLVVISRLLAPREIGIYTIAMAALGIIQVFTTFGIASFVVREPEMPQATLESAFTVNAILIVSLSMLLMGLSFAAGPVLGAPEAGSVLRILSISNLFAIVNFRPAAMLQREMLFKPLSMIMVANVTTQTAATICFAVAGLSYMSAAYASLLSVLVSTLMTQKLGRRYISFRISLVGWRPITTFGLQMMSVSGVAMLNGKLSDLLVGRLLGVTALGFYGRASQLSAIIFDNLYGTATRVVFVQLSKDYRDGGNWRETYLRGFSMITAFMWPFLIGLAILSRPAIHLLYGKQWLPAALPLAAMMVSQLIGVAFGMNWELFVLRGETGKQARFEAARFLLGIPIFAVGCLFNILWAAIAKIPDALIGLVLYYPHVRRLAQLDSRAIPLVYRDSALLTLVAVLPAMIAMITYDWSPTTPLPVVFGAVFVGITLWFGTIILMGHPLRDEMRVIGRKLNFARTLS